jgi:branched-chain amino acid transport system permease protein
MDILPQVLVNGLIAGSLYALVALGFNLAYGATKFFNLAHGALSVVGGYTALAVLRDLGWGLGWAIVIGILMSAGIGWLLDKFIYLPLRKRKASNMVLLVASLGAFTAIQAIIAILFTSQFQTLLAGESKIIDLFGYAVVTGVQLSAFVTVAVVGLGLYLILKFTRFGKAVRAVSDDGEVARIVGIQTDKIVGTVFLIASGLAGLAGILIGFDTGLEPTMGMSLLLKGVIASIVGGIGNVYCGIAGAFLLGIIENLGVWQFSGEWKDAIAFGLLIIFLLFRPKGIFKN